jgi:osmotically-inducible protein OsmY
MKKWQWMAIGFCVLSSLQGCSSVAMSGASAVYNHRSIQKNLNDQIITYRAYRAINQEKQLFASANISVATFNNEVLIAGQAPNVAQKSAVTAIVKSVPNVSQVYNMVKLESPSSSITRMSDAWITAKIKAKMIASDDVDATQVKVVTEDGTVYLMGILPPEEAAAAVQIASSTDGVGSVVKVFSYIKITKTA